MAKCEIEFPYELEIELSKLGKHADEITAKALKAGAEAILPIFRENLSSVIGAGNKFSDRSTGELVSSLGISPAKLDRSGNMNIMVGFREPRRGNGKVKNALIANVLENGKHGQTPRPFLKRTKQQSSNAALAAAQRAFDEGVKDL